MARTPGSPRICREERRMNENNEPGTRKVTRRATPKAAEAPASVVQAPDAAAQAADAPAMEPPVPPAEAAPKAPTRRRAPARPKAAAPVKAQAEAAKPRRAKPAARKPVARAEPVEPARPEATPPGEAIQPARAMAPNAVKDDAKADKKDKEKKEKVVRDSFSLPRSEHAAIKQMRTEIARAGRIASKSEILRAALKALADQGPAKALDLIEALPVVPKGKAKKA